MDMFDNISKSVFPLFAEGWDKFRSYLGRFFKDFDIHLLKLKKVIDESKRELRYFLEERDRIHKELRLKEWHIDRLRRELSSLKEDQHASYQSVHHELTQKLDELLHIQAKFLEVDAKIKSYEQKLRLLTEEKRTVEEDRKKIRSEYEQINKAYHEKENELKILTAEIAGLKEKELYYQSILEKNQTNEDTEIIRDSLEQLQVSLEQKENERASLEKKYDELETKKKEIERELIQMTLLLHEKSANILQLTNQLEQVNLEKDNYRESLANAEKDLKHSQNQVNYYQSELTTLEKKEAELQKELLLANQEKDQLQAIAESQLTEFISSMDKYEQDIHLLQEELEKQQNENAMLVYEHENGKVLSEEERKILEKEYEPRFHAIYPNMVFTPQFFMDFFHLTVSDRIKVELKIAQLHYRFDSVDSSIRKNTVKTRIGAIAEFPFSQEGRIYFRRHNHLIYVYRLNRTKNEQPFVIKWLQHSL
ncbi:hypothetical protein ACI7RC_27440 [Brevibacillus sp. B_LB10_24]|uniref:hypothetical protein n=1 Tax=Brevibacillus sp. B_LB10_24 TaxID=3380645 RepID=UPI0038BA9C24